MTLLAHASRPSLRNVPIEVLASAHLKPSYIGAIQLLGQLISPRAISLEVVIRRQGLNYLVRVPQERLHAARTVVAAHTGADAEEFDLEDVIQQRTKAQFIGQPVRPEPYLLYAAVPADPAGDYIPDASRALGQVCPLLRSDESVLCQLLVQRADDKFVQRYQQLGLQHAFLRQDAATAADPPPSPKALAANALAMVSGASAAFGLAFPLVFGLALSTPNLLAGLLGAVGLSGWWRLRSWAYGQGIEPVSPQLVQQKLEHPACWAALRLTLYADPRPEILFSLENILRLHDRRADGNGFRLVQTSFDPWDLSLPREDCWMNLAEIATFFHQDPRYARRARFSWIPPEDGIFPPGGGFPFAVAGHAPDLDVVRLSIDRLCRYAGLFISSRGGGKSSVRQSILQGCLTEIAGFENASIADLAIPAILNVDPLSGQGRYDFGDYPRELVDQLHILSCDQSWKAVAGWSFTYNPLWCKSGRPDDIARRVEALLEAWRFVFQEVRDSSWGDRLEKLIRLVFGAIAHANANQADGPNYGLLDALHMMRYHTFGEQVIREAQSQELEAEWHDWYMAYPPTVRLEINNPLSNKLDIIAENQTYRRVFGGVSSSLDLGDLLDKGHIVTIDLPDADLGRGATRGLTATLINMLLLHLQDRSRVHPEQRRPVLMLIDEPHMLGVDFGSAYTILRQMGGAPYLFTQTMEHFDRIETLRGLIQANLGAVFFNSVTNPSDLQLQEKWLEGLVPPSASWDIDTAYWYGRVKGYPPFSFKALPPERLNTNVQKKAEDLIKRDKNHIYLPNGEIDDAHARHWAMAMEHRRQSAQNSPRRSHPSPGSASGGARAGTSETPPPPGIAFELANQPQFVRVDVQAHGADAEIAPDERGDTPTEAADVQS